MTDSDVWHVIEDRGDYLYVGGEGCLSSHELRSRYQNDIEAAMRPELKGRVLFDNRGVDAGPEDVRAALWTWFTVTSSVRRAAIVAHNARVTKRVDRTAALNRLVFQGFQTIEDAEAWLRRGL